MKDVMKRIKNPIFILAISGLVYQILKQNGISVELGQFQLIADMFSYAFIGSGIYSTFKTS